MEQAKVNKTHSIYDKNQPKRDLFAAVMAGTDGVRAGDKRYLPQYPGEEGAEYTIRKDASTIDGVVAEGQVGLSGKVFHGEIDTSKVNASIIPLLENIDNQGTHFNIFARRSFDAAFDGFSVILIDTPKAQGPVKSLEDEKRQGIRPYWRLYKAKDVTNWRYVVDQATKQTRLSLLVLKECSEEPDGQFGSKEVTRYRVYRHEQAVTVETWVQKAKDAQGEEFIPEMPATTLDKLTAIPAAIVGNIDAEPWLLNESRLEIKAYQKESSFDVIQYLQLPVFYTKGYPDDGPTLALGAHTHIRLPLEGDVGYAQTDASGNAQLEMTVSNIKSTIGGRLDAITKEAMQGAEETATEVVSDDSKSQARLIVWSQQLKDALERALQFTAEFMGLGSDKGGEIVLMTAWEAAKAEAKEAKDFDRTIVVDKNDIEREKIAAKAGNK
jgi:hypothetical protein